MQNCTLFRLYAESRFSMHLSSSRVPGKPDKWPTLHPGLGFLPAVTRCRSASIALGSQRDARQNRIVPPTRRWNVNGDRKPSAAVYRVLRQRVSLVRDGSVQSPWKRFGNSRDAFQFGREALYAAADREQFHVRILDGKNRLIGVNLVSQGSLTSSVVRARSSRPRSSPTPRRSSFCTSIHPATLRRAARTGSARPVSHRPAPFSASR